MLRITIAVVDVTSALSESADLNCIVSMLCCMFVYTRRFRSICCDSLTSSLISQRYVRTGIAPSEYTVVQLSCQVPNFVCHRISSVSRIVTTYHKADMKNVCFLHMRNRLRKLQPLLRSVHTFTDCSWKAPSGTAACNCCVTPHRLLHAQQHRYCTACQLMPLLLLLLCYRLAAEALMFMSALCTRYCPTTY
jgi:hypothetical protein